MLAQRFKCKKLVSALPRIQLIPTRNIQQLEEDNFINNQPKGVQGLLSDSNLYDLYKRYLSRDTYLPTTQNITTATALPPEAYSNDAFYKLEQEKVFKKTWVAIGAKSSLSNNNDVLSTFIGSNPIIITNHNNQLKGFYNVCRHRGSILLEPGKYNQKHGTIICPYHCWTYSCCGKLKGTPYFNDTKMPLTKQQKDNPDLVNKMADFPKTVFNKKDYSLFEFGVKEFMGTVYVNLDDDIDRREELWKYQFGDLDDNYGYYPWDEMVVISEIEYTVNCNWKLISENFMEYYHLPWVHPELCEVSSVANHIRRQGKGQYVGFGAYPLSYGDTATDPDVFTPFNGLNNADIEAGWYIHMFPNISYFILPHHVILLITYPQSSGVTKEKFIFLMDKSIKSKLDNDNDNEIKSKIKKLQDFWINVNDQDIAAVERVQKGIACNNVYRGGKFSSKFEEPVYRFQNYLIDYMTDEYLKEYPGDKDFVKSEFLINKS